MASAGGSAPAVGESVGVEGADAGGVEGRSFVRGDDAYAGGGRGNVLLRRRLAAVNAHLEKLTPLPRPQVSLASLSADQVAAQRSRGAAEKTAMKIVTDEIASVTQSYRPLAVLYWYIHYADYAPTTLHTYIHTHQYP